MAEHNKCGKWTLPSLLFHCLEECTEAEIKCFKFHLSQHQLDGFVPIPRGRVEKMDIVDLVDRMIMAYCQDGAAEVVLHILRKMNQNELAQKLERDMLSTHEQRCPDLDRKSGDCSSDSEDSVYWDAEEGNPVSGVAQGPGSVELSYVTNTSVSAKQEEEISLNQEGGCGASMIGLSEVQEEGPFAKDEVGSLIAVTGEDGGKEESSLQQHKEGNTTLIINLSEVQKEGVSTENEAEGLITATNGCGKQEEGLSQRKEDGETASTTNLPVGQDVVPPQAKDDVSARQHEASESSAANGTVVLQDERAQHSAESSNILEMLAVELTFKMVNQTLQKLVFRELERFKKRLLHDHPEMFEQGQDQDVQDIVKTLLQSGHNQEALNIILQSLRAIDQEELASHLEKEAGLQKMQNELWFKLRREFRRIF